MRVLFDGYWWFKGPFANRSVQRDLILTWRECYPEDDLVVAVRRKDSDGAAKVTEGISAVQTRLWPQALSNFVELASLARRVRADVVLAHNYTPLAGRAAVFIHDAMFVEHPEWFSPRERLYFWSMVPSARRAAQVLTSTATEAARIEQASGGRTVVWPTGLAVPRSLAEAVPQRPEDVPDAGHFAVVVGRLNVRKNLEAVVRGAGLANSIGPECPLLVVGATAYSGLTGELPDDLANLVASGAVRFLSRISDPELAWLYAHASLAISLSLDEGFGLPAIEAAHFGAPLLASDIKVFRETVGDYAHFVDPLAPAARIAEAIDDAWESPGSDAALVELRSRYNWPAVVATLRAALDQG